MKTAILLLSFFLVSMQSFAWEKIIDCNDGDMVVDRECSYPGICNYQIVIREQGVFSYLTNDIINRDEWVVRIYQQPALWSFVGYDGPFTLDVRQLQGTPSIHIGCTSRYFRGQPMTRNWTFESCRWINY